MIKLRIEEASPFTLYGTVLTGEVGSDELTARDGTFPKMVPTRRFGLPMV